jgi:hypothetical protein
MAVHKHGTQPRLGAAGAGRIVLAAAAVGAQQSGIGAEALLLLLARVLLRRIDVEIGFAVPPESVPSQTRGHVVGVAVAAWVIQPAVGSRATSRCSSQA